MPLIQQLLDKNILTKPSKRNDPYGMKDCSGNLDFSFTFSGRTFALSKLQLVEQTHDGSCTAKIQPTDESLFMDTPAFILGSPFLNKICHAYDYDKGVMMIGETVSKIS
jgi:hypothetical protein